MIYLHKNKRYTAILIVVVMLLLTVKLPSFAATEVNESESNDTMATADVTYDDYTARGALIRDLDVDYWKYTATSNGFANIWLGSIPSGKDYNIFLYNSSGSYMACSVQTNSTQEIMKCRLKAGATYYVRIESASGWSDSKYKLRIKNYALGNANLFAYDTINSEGNDFDTTLFAEESLPYFFQRGYGGDWYLNNTVGPAYNVLPSSRVFIVGNHANKGLMQFDNSYTNITYLYANQISGMSASNRALSNIGDLSNVALIIFAGCYSGLTGQTTGNLVNMAISKGAQCAIGWENSIYYPKASKWLIQFVYNCGLDKNITNASTAADNYMRENYDLDEEYYYSALFNRETGTSRPTSIVI